MSSSSLSNSDPASSELSHSSLRRDAAVCLRLAIAFLLLTALLSLLWSNVRLMDNDEFLSFYGDRSPTAASVVRVQLRSPISLDPPAYHLLSHLSMKLLGANSLALRVPALAGFLLFQAGLFFFVRRLSSPRAAVVAIALPLLTATFQYSVEGRPYGLLLGSYALLLASWQNAIRGQNSGHNASRLLPLLGIALSIAFSITSHYFGILILIPICCGELARSLHRRRIDLPMLSAIAAGAASLALILPFRTGLVPYRRHYYNTGVGRHTITQSYRELFLRYTLWPIPCQRAAALALAVMTLALAAAAWRRFRRRPAAEPAHEWIALLALALLPLFAYLLGRFVTHTLEVRYVVASIFAFAATLAIVLEPLLRRDRIFYSLAAALTLAALILNLANIARERRLSREILASFTLSPGASAAILHDPSAHLYTQSLNDFFLNTCYAPDPALRNRLSLLYGQQQEIRWLGHDTNYVTAINLQRFAPLSVTSYADFLAQPAPLLLLYHSGWEWIDKDLASRQTPIKRLGSALRGDLVQLRNGPLTPPPSTPYK